MADDRRVIRLGPVRARGRRRVKRLLTGGILFLAATAVIAAGGSADPQILEDGETFRPDRIVNDVELVVFRVGDRNVEVEVRFRKPFTEMMFQAVELRADCDADGSPLLFGADAMEYDPAARKIRIRGLALEKGERYRVRAGNLHDVFGRPVPPGEEVEAKAN